MGWIRAELWGALAAWLLCAGGSALLQLLSLGRWFHCSSGQDRLEVSRVGKAILKS